MISNIKAQFDSSIKRRLNTEPDKLRFVLYHEKKEKVLNNLCYEIVKAEKRIITFSTKKYVLLIETVAKMFIDTTLRYRQEQNISKTEKLRRRKEGNRVEELEKEYKQMEKETVRNLFKVYQKK